LTGFLGSQIVWFIDKLNVSQNYPEGGLPLIGKHGIVRHDIATGELVSNSVNSLPVEGSFSSSLQIRCTGNSVSITGNPSRFERSDNLWGFTKLDECMEVYNTVLSQYGLPPFTRCESIGMTQTPDGKRSRLVADGAVINHVDWTRNYEVGQGREYSFLRGASSLTIGRGLEPYLYTNGATLEWGSSKLKLRGEGSTYRYDKLYLKAKDLIDHKAKRLKNATDSERKYYETLIEYCQDHGVVREEQSKKSPLLKRHGTLAYYGFCTEEDFHPYLLDIEVALGRLEVNHMNYETIADQLIQNEICKSRQSANATEGYAFKWLHGSSIDKAKSQYHVHRSRLLQLGIDIAMPYDVTRLAPQIRSVAVIESKILSPPSWYKMPTRGCLKAA